MTAANGGKTRACPECKVRFPIAGRRVCCGDDCARRRQQRQLKEATDARGEARRQARAKAKPVPCSVCRTPFLPGSTRALYCSDQCRDEGLRRAVQRQRERRQAKRQQFTEISQ